MARPLQELRRRVLAVPGARPIAEVIRDLVREWQRDRVTGLAAEMSFFALLAVFPLLLALAAALGSMEAVVGGDAASRAEDAVIEVLERNLTEEGADIVEEAQRLFAEGSPGVLTFGIIAALWAGSRGFVGVINALDTAYNVQERRGYLGLRATALLLSLGTVLVAALLLVILVLGPLMGTGQDVADAVGAGDAFAWAWDRLRAPAVFLGVLAWAATVFHVGPNHASPWRWDLPGAALTGLLWVATSFGFRAYLAVAGEGSLFLGALGGTLVLVLWLYALSISLLAGAELNAVLARRAGVAQQERV